MQKLCLLLAIGGALLALQVQQSTAFALGAITIQKGYAASVPAFTSTVALPSPNALLQGITSVITGKLTVVQSLVGQVLQLKQGIKESLLRSVASASSAASNTSGNLFTKTITINKGFVPVVTAASGASGATVAKTSGYTYGK